MVLTSRQQEKTNNLTGSGQYLAPKVNHQKKHKLKSKAALIRMAKALQKMRLEYVVHINI